MANQAHAVENQAVYSDNEVVDAGHRAIAESMCFVDHGEIELERLESERAAERRRSQST